MIKKSLLWIFISFVWSISYSFGAWIVRETSTSNFWIWETELYYQPYQSEFQVLTDWNFKTNDIYNWLQFRWESRQTKATTFWYQWDIAFIHGNKLVSNEWRCYNSTPNINPTNCGDYSSDINSIVSINQNKLFSGFWVFAVWWQNSRQWYSSDRFYFCFYNEHSYCVKSWIPNNASNNVSNLCSDNYNGCNISNFESILIWTSPFITQNNNWWNNIRTWKNYYCPTYREVLQNYWNKYNTWLCYNWTLKYENGSITTVQQKDIFTVFSNYNEYTQRINLYYNNCKAPATQQQCENVFNWQREKYSIIANAMNNGVDEKWLRNYCNIWLNYDLNTTTCVASTWSTYKEPITTNELLEHIENLTDIWTVIIPSTWNIINWLLGEWQTREDINARDLIWNLDQIKEKLSTMFTERSWVEWIIPDYIMWLILVSLLLTVLFKK